VRDVASKAGVSPKTVSNVLNDSSIVAPDTRERVLAAIDVLGYRRNLAARALRTRRSSTIGLIVPSITNPYYPEVVRGVQDVADARGYVVIVGNSDGRSARDEAFLRLLVEQRVDGIVIQTRRHDPDLDIALRAQIPVVVGSEAHPACDSVYTDDEHGAYLATRYLVELGHRRIAHLGGTRATPGMRRVRGYKRALSEAGIGVDAALVVETEFDRPTGRWAVGQFLDARVDFTALFAANDVLAFGALDALRRAGRRVPDDVSVVGFDDVAEAAEIDPPLTTVVNPAYVLGTRAAEMLFERIDGQAGPARRVALPTDLIVRGTTRAATPARQPV
jgi:LacI family transcriptional regulator